MGPMIPVLVLLMILPVVGLIWWSVAKQGKLKKEIQANWPPLAQELGGQLEPIGLPGGGSVLRVGNGKPKLECFISNAIIVDASMTDAGAANNEFRTQVVAHRANPGPSYVLSGVSSGKGNLNQGPQAVQQSVELSRDSGFGNVATQEALEHLGTLVGELQEGGVVIAGPNTVSFVFGHNRTDVEPVRRAAHLIAALGGVPVRAAA